jgi:hypothetical protein
LPDVTLSPLRCATTGISKEWQGMATKPVILVLESDWARSLRERPSVYPFMHGMCEANEWTLYYRHFDSLNDIDLWIERFQRMRPKKGSRKIVYLAAHGEKSGIRTLETCIPGEKLIPIFEKAPSIVGMHFASCYLCQTDLPRKLVEKNHLKWVAGYTKEVDWLESTLVDLLFLHWMYIGVPRKQRSRRLGIEKTPEELYRKFEISETLGFTVFYRPKYAREVESSLERWLETKPSAEILKTEVRVEITKQEKKDDRGVEKTSQVKERVTGIKKKPRAGPKKRVAKIKKPRIGSKKPQASSKKPRTGSKKPQASSKKPQAGSGKRPRPKKERG